MSTAQNQFAATLPISVVHADALEDKLYEIEELSLTMQEILNSDFHHDLALCAIAALRKEMHLAFQECSNILEKAGVLASARVPASSGESAGAK